MSTSSEADSTRLLLEDVSWVESPKERPRLCTIGRVFDVLYFINDDVDTFRVEGKYQFMTEQSLESLFQRKVRLATRQAAAHCWGQISDNNSYSSQGDSIINLAFHNITTLCETRRLSTIDWECMHLIEIV